MILHIETESFLIHVQIFITAGFKMFFEKFYVKKLKILHEKKVVKSHTDQKLDLLKIYMYLRKYLLDFFSYVSMYFNWSYFSGNELHKVMIRKLVTWDPTLETP